MVDSVGTGGGAVHYPGGFFVETKRDVSNGAPHPVGETHATSNVHLTYIKRDPHPNGPRMEITRPEINTADLMSVLAKDVARRPTSTPPQNNRQPTP